MNGNTDDNKYVYSFHMKVLSQIKSKYQWNIFLLENNSVILTCTWKNKQVRMAKKRRMYMGGVRKKTGPIKY